MTRVLLASLLVGVVALQIHRVRQQPASVGSAPMIYLQSPAVARRLALSFEAIAADIYWIRAIQYYGSTRLGRNPDTSYGLLYPLLDITTTLDPEFNIAYRVGAFFLSEEMPAGPGRPDLAIRLLEKAMAARPTRWEYPHDVGFVLYRDGDYRRAAQWFERASSMPAAPSWLKPLAAVTLATGGDLRTARVLWQNLLASTSDTWQRREAERRLQQLDAVDLLRELERRVAIYAARRGAPRSWNDLITARLLPGEPIDPRGHAFVLENGRVTLAHDSPLWPLPVDGAR